MAFDVPAGSPPSTPLIPVSVARVTERTTREGEAVRPLRSNLRTRFRARLCFALPFLASCCFVRRHWNSTSARMVKVMPAGGGANSKVQPA
jgi:hypothetical protein